MHDSISIRQSIGPSVCQSIGPSVTPWTSTWISIMQVKKNLNSQVISWSCNHSIIMRTHHWPYGPCFHQMRPRVGHSVHLSRLRENQHFSMNQSWRKPCRLCRACHEPYHRAIIHAFMQLFMNSCNHLCILANIHAFLQSFMHSFKQSFMLSSLHSNKRVRF